MKKTLPISRKSPPEPSLIYTVPRKLPALQYLTSAQKWHTPRISPRKHLQPNLWSWSLHPSNVIPRSLVKKPQNDSPSINLGITPSTSNLAPDWRIVEYIALRQQKTLPSKLTLQNTSRKVTSVPSKSPMASPFFFVGKKDGSKLHPVQDYQKLNDITIKNQIPLFLIPELLNKL